MKTKKIFALLLSALLCLSMIPFAAFAANPTTLPDGEEYALVSMMKNPEYKISNGQSGSDENGMKLEQEASSALIDNFSEVLATADGIMFRLDNTAASNTEATYLSFTFAFNYTDASGAPKSATLCTDLHRALARGKVDSTVKESYNGTATTWYMTTDNGATWSEVKYEYITSGDNKTSGWTCQKVTDAKVNAYIFIPAEAIVCDSDLNADGKVDSLAEVAALNNFAVTKMSAAANNPTMKAAETFVTDLVFVTEPAPVPALPANIPVSSMPTSCTATAVYMMKNPEFRVSNGSTAEGGFDENSMKLEKKNTVCLTDDFSDNFRTADGILFKVDTTNTPGTAAFRFAIDFLIKGTDANGEAIETKFSSSATRAVAHKGTAKDLIPDGTVSTWYMTTDNGATWTPIVDTLSHASVSSGWHTTLVSESEKVSGYIYIPFDAMYCRDDLDGDGVADTYADLAAKMGDDYTVDYIYIGANANTARDANAFWTDFMLVTEGDAHNMGAASLITAPTHTTFGLNGATCSKCNAIIGELVDKTPDHTYTYMYEIDEADASKHFGICKCGAKAEQSEAHAFNTLVPDEADASKHVGACVCGATDGHSADHVWDNGVVTKEPTVNKKGEKTYTCDDCGATKTEELAKLTPADNSNVTTTPAPVEEEDGGCGSVISTGAGMMIALAGAAMLLKKKRK